MEQTQPPLLHQPQLLTSSLSPGDKRLPDVSDIEHRRSFDIVPVLLGERVDP